VVAYRFDAEVMLRRELQKEAKSSKPIFEIAHEMRTPVKTMRLVYVI
jgi:hypothetical protein